MMQPKVFISYSHKDDDWEERLRTHLGVLEHQDILVLWDDKLIEGGADWYQEIDAAMQDAQVAVFLVTANFLTSKFILSEEVPTLMQRRADEGLIIYPIIAEPCAWQEVPWLTKMQLRPPGGKALSGGNDHEINSNLADITLEIARRIRLTPDGPQIGGHPPLAADHISLDRLPSTSPELFGRDEELKQLTDAWEDPAINIISLVAWGGVGKTALVNKWLLDMRQKNYAGAQRVFGWSFYSQGTDEKRLASADQFVAAALKWFGDPKPDKGSVWEKSERLAHLINEHRTLLVLDGLEPLQEPAEGRLNDKGMQALLRTLARNNDGMVVFSTRLAVDDLKDFKGESVKTAFLDNLSPEAGAEYLKSQGVGGSKADLKKASREYGGHALALTLLGSYVKVALEGDIRRRDEIKKLTEVPEKGEHARRMISSYAQWLAGKPELDILRLMGLFDRPAEGAALDVPKAEPVIDGLTNTISQMTAAKFQFAVDHLRALRLLAEKDDQNPQALDCHPLIREYFSEKLQKEKPEAWKEAHSRLYEYYKDFAPELPDTLEEMTPLFLAVVHGAQADRHQEALVDVYFERIQRSGSENFCMKKLGATGAELTVLSNFFDEYWDKPVTGLDEFWRAGLLNWAGFRLCALGRLAQAIPPTQLSLEYAIAEKDWDKAAIASANLCGIFMMKGELSNAEETIRQGVKLADRSKEQLQSIHNRADLAWTLHQTGRLTESATIFNAAVALQKEMQPAIPFLYSLGGFQFCDLLLSQEKYTDVIIQANKAIVIAKEAGWLRGIAMDNLSLGRAYLYQAMEESQGDYSQAEVYLNKALDGLRESGDYTYLPNGLLARAELWLAKKDLEKAHTDLEEALEIATRGGMRIHEADCQLGFTHLFLAEGKKKPARERLKIAAAMIDEMGYQQRDMEVKELKKQLK